MELRKVILRYTDGRTLPAYAPIFEEGQDPLPIVDLEGQPLQAPLEGLKALFFVRTFSGNPDYDGPGALEALPYPEGGGSCGSIFSTGSTFSATWLMPTRREGAASS